MVSRKRRGRNPTMFRRVPPTLPAFRSNPSSRRSRRNGTNRSSYLDEIQTKKGIKRRRRRCVTPIPSHTKNQKKNPSSLPKDDRIHHETIENETMVKKKGSVSDPARSIFPSLLPTSRTRRVKASSEFPRTISKPCRVCVSQTRHPIFVRERW